MSPYHEIEEYHPDSAMVKYKPKGYHYLFNTSTGTELVDFSHNPEMQNGSYTTRYNLTYSITFPFETTFNTQFYVNWMTVNHWVCNIFIAAYLLFIWGMTNYMKNRQKFDLRRLLVVWNIILAVFSIGGALRTLPEMVFLLSNHGFNFCVCMSGLPFLDNRVGGFWNWMFTLSKVPELGDTVFIVLRKQPLIFLHWYHHVTVLLYTWYSYSDYIATARWFVCMNYLVHSVMYSYYALKALRVNVPKFIAMIITSLQLAQMVMGTAVNIWAYQVKTDGNECHVSMDNIKISLAMYSSYFILFAQFFYRVYFQKPKELEMKKKQDKKHD